jgi:subtilase family serine protease
MPLFAAQVSKSLNSITILSFAMLVAQPIWAERPTDGFARPPIHIKGNATKAPTGLSPAQVRHGYGFDLIANQGEGQIIAIVDAYDDPNIASDLNTFKNTFGITGCSFTKMYAQGRPKSDPGWSLEISLDVEWACAIAPKAQIILVEAANASFTNLFGAVDVAVATGATAISMSWGGNEFSSEVTSGDGHFVQQGVVFTVSSGDSGTGVEYPAASPYVLAVGGTTLNLNGDSTYSSETAWSGSGGGVSSYEPRPAWQAVANSLSGRGVPDVAYDADPASGFSVYDTVRYQGQSGWFKVGGTSAGAPQWAAFAAIVNSGRVALGKSTLSGAGPMYSSWSAAVSNYHDITSGSNGSCGALCNAGTGYDYVTGLGSQVLPNLYNDLVSQP